MSIEITTTTLAPFEITALENDAYAVNVNPISVTNIVTDATLVTSDITTNNASIDKHGFLKKLSGVATEYMDGAGNWTSPASGLTTYTTPNSWTGETFFDTYFDYDVADLAFTNCIFLGVCYLKNIGGTITHVNSKGGVVISNLPIPDTVRGWGDVTDTEF